MPTGNRLPRLQSDTPVGTATPPPPPPLPAHLLRQCEALVAQHHRSGTLPSNQPAPPPSLPTTSWVGASSRRRQPNTACLSADTRHHPTAPPGAPPASARPAGAGGRSPGLPARPPGERVGWRVGATVGGWVDSVRQSCGPTAGQAPAQDGAVGRPHPAPACVAIIRPGPLASQAPSRAAPAPPRRAARSRTAWRPRCPAAAAARPHPSTCKGWWTGRRMRRGRVRCGSSGGSARLQRTPARRRRR